MSSPANTPHPQHLRASDIRAIAQLAAEATVGVSRIAEGVHQSVWRTIGVPGGAVPGRSRGITGLVYSSVRGISQLVGGCVTGVLGGVEALIGARQAVDSDSPQREAVLAALNGVMGDHLVASGNPLAVPMSLRYRGGELELRKLPPMPEATGRVLVLMHGLCMSDRHWSPPAAASGVNPGEVLSAELGFTPVFLRYNSGLPVARNGQLLSTLLEELLAQWPVPIEDVTVVAHSMGGLLIRSAVHGATEAGARWPNHLRSIVFLGTPHHGAPLEQAGGWVDRVLSTTRFTAPFASLGRLRSAGITDLRHGSILAAADHPADGHHGGPASPQHVPLPGGVACFAAAATTAASEGALANRLVGDGLVPLRSALGRHRDPRRCLAFAEGSQRVFYAMNHMELLTNRRVVQQILEWLGPIGSPPSCR